MTAGCMSEKEILFCFDFGWFVIRLPALPALTVIDVSTESSKRCSSSKAWNVKRSQHIRLC